MGGCFPNELVIEILSRLPLTSLIRFRLVCKEWCLLTSTQFFIEMHGNNQPTESSAFVVQYFDRKRTVPQFQLKTLFINEKATNKNNKFQMVREYIDLTTQARDFKKYYCIDLLSSYKGFLLFTAKSNLPSGGDSALILYNPVTKEQLTVTAPPSGYVYCGFFFHSPTKEYRILYQVFDCDNKDVTLRFELLGLQTRSLRKICVNERFSAKYHPDLSTPAVISNGALHWMVSEAHHKKVFGGAVPSCSETILSFEMESEEFCLMPHPRLCEGFCFMPHPTLCSGLHDCVSAGRGGVDQIHQMNLLEMDGGILCLCDGYNFYSKLNIFVMENYEKWAWVLKLVLPFNRYPNYWVSEYGLHLKALQIHQGELLLYYHPHDYKEEYLLYPLNQEEEEEEEEPDDASSKDLEEEFECFDDDNLILKKKKKKKRFKVVIDQLHLWIDFLEGDQTVWRMRRIRRIVIEHPGSLPKSRQVPSAYSVGNIVVLTPSIASLQQHHHQSGGGGGNYILSLQYENHNTVLKEYDVQAKKWRRVLVADTSSCSY